jgi:acetyl-CoA carboxylase carboxyltransferase component
MNLSDNIQKQHNNGKYHALERIFMILDKDSFYETDSSITNYIKTFNDLFNCDGYDGIITGYGKINNQTVFIYSQDFCVLGGTLGLIQGHKIANTIKRAIEAKCPIIGINDSGGARIQEGVNALAGYGEIFYYNTLASGFIPQISIIAGPCAGGAAYSPGITDFIFMINKISQMFVTGPVIVESATGQNISIEELGGCTVHSRISGVNHFCYDNEYDCYQALRKLFEYLPSSSEAPLINHVNYKYTKKVFPNIKSIFENDFKKVYNIKNIINAIFDENSFLEVQEDFAKNIVIGFAKICDISVGIIANQPNYLCGVLDCDSSDKAARFIRFCDSFTIPLITFVDVPGFLPGLIQEQLGIIRHGAKLIYSYADSTTPKISIILRKAFGGAYIAMSSKHLHSDFVYIWDNAQIAVMGSEGAVSILYNKELKNLKTEKEIEEFKKIKIELYESQYLNSYVALKQGYIDDVIKPEETRDRIYKDLFALKNKSQARLINKKHGNIPL